MCQTISNLQIHHHENSKLHMATLTKNRLTHSQILQTSLHLHFRYFNNLQYIQALFTDSKQITNLQLVHQSSSVITLITQTVKLNSSCDLKQL